MPEAGCRSRFLRIQYHAEGRDATSFRGESGPETAFRGGFRGEDRFGGQNYPAGCQRTPPTSTPRHRRPQRKRPGVPQPHASQSIAARLERRTSISSSKLPSSRYTENKVLFSVPCVYARETFFSGLFWAFRDATKEVTRHRIQSGPAAQPIGSRGAANRVPQRSQSGPAAQPIGSRGGTIMSGGRKRAISPGGLCTSGVFSRAFLLKRRHFSLKKWKRMAYYFNLVF